MGKQIEPSVLLLETRSRVYLLWAVLLTIGYVATHYFQRKQINGVWTVISIVGLGYMFRVMPMRVRQMQRIFTAWLVPILIGMAVSAAVFYVRDWAVLIQYLGGFWLLVMAAGYFWNGLVDPPSGWYWFATIINVTAGVLVFYYGPFLDQQYIVAAIISAWSMANLWLFRS